MSGSVGRLSSAVCRVRFCRGLTETLDRQREGVRFESLFEAGRDPTAFASDRKSAPPSSIQRRRRVDGSMWARAGVEVIPQAVK